MPVAGDWRLHNDKEKAFNLQENESRAAAERAREAGRGGTAGAEAGAPEADAGGKKKGGLLSKMFKGMGSAVLLPIKALFSAFSMIGKIFGGIGNKKDLNTMPSANVGN